MATISVDQDSWNAISGFYRISSVNGLTQAATPIFTVPAGKTFYPLRVLVEPTTVTGLITPSVVSVGTNATNYNNIMASNALTGLTGTNTISQIAADLGAIAVAAGTQVFARVITAATADAYTLRIILIGILI